MLYFLGVVSLVLLRHASTSLGIKSAPSPFTELTGVRGAMDTGRGETASISGLMMPLK